MIPPVEALDIREAACPYCGEPVELLVDCPEPGQRYVEDCQVCCRPIDVEWLPMAGSLGVRLRREDDA